MDKYDIYKNVSPILYGISPNLRNKILDKSQFKQKMDINIENPRS